MTETISGNLNAWIVLAPMIGGGIAWVFNWGRSGDRITIKELRQDKAELEGNKKDLEAKIVDLQMKFNALFQEHASALARLETLERLNGIHITQPIGSAMASLMGPASGATGSEAPPHVS